MNDTSTLLSRLQANIVEVEQDPSVPLNEALFEECEIFLVPQLQADQATLTGLVSRVARLIPSLQQSPQPVVQLLTKLIDPFEFSDILNLSPPVDFVAGLDVSVQSLNPLVLRLLAKAARSTKDAAIVAGMPNVVRQLVKLWLSTPETGVADIAATVLLDLLTVDKERSDVIVHGIGESTSRSSGGQGLVWRRMFGDRDVYGLLYSICSLQDRSDQSLSKKQKTVSQARLLALIPKLGHLDWDYLVRSHHRDIESLFGMNPEREGLLDFVCVHLVEAKNDVLIHMTLIQFYADLITTVRRCLPTNRDVSISLQFLRERGLHERIISLWLDPSNPSHDPIDVSFLYGPSAHYLGVYAAIYPKAFLGGADAHQVLIRLSQALDISANQWAHGQSPKHDLKVLTSLPSIALLPQRGLGTGRRSNPLLLVPCKVTNAEALNALAKIFSRSTGAQNNSSESDTDVTSTLSDHHAELAAARAAYIAYVYYHDGLFGDLVTHADTVALPEKALAAIHLLSSIVTATYQPLPSSDHFNTSALPSSVHDLPSSLSLPSLLRLVAGSPLPTVTAETINGILASPARERILPWLLRPPQTYTNLVGGRGDPDSAAYRIAMAKWDLLLLLHGKIKSLVDKGERVEEGLDPIMEVLQNRIRDGPWGATAEAGGRIATLDL